MTLNERCARVQQPRKEEHSYKSPAPNSPKYWHVGSFISLMVANGCCNIEPPSEITGYMPSVGQSVSAILSLAFVVVGLGAWWWSDVDSEAKSTHAEYLKVADAHERLVRVRHKRETDVDESLEALDELKSTREDQTVRSADDAGELLVMGRTVAALQDQADVPRYLTAWLAYVLLPVDAERPETVQNTLGTELDGNRVSFSLLDVEDGGVVLEGEAASKEEVEQLLPRLQASGYLKNVQIVDVRTRTDESAQSTYAEFKITAMVRAPHVPQAVREALE